MKKNTIGLLERIKVAASVEALDSLMSEGSTYSMAHPSTRRRWKKAHKARLAFLGTGSEVKVTK